MIKRLSLAVVLFVALFAVSGIVVAEDEMAGNESMMEEAAPEVGVDAPVNAGNKVCPVTGEKIENPGAYTVEYEGIEYNLCCPECKEVFLADPDKYVAKVEEELSGQVSGDEGMMDEEAGMDEAAMDDGGSHLH